MSGLTRTLAVVALSLALVAPAQLPELPRVTKSVELTITNVDVVVTDRRGDHVLGLTADDFEVFQDRRAVTITNFREVRPESPPAGAVAAPSAPSAGSPPVPLVEAPEATRPRRTVVLFVDRLRLPDPQVRRPFFSSLAELLRKVIGPGDAGMIVSWNRSMRTVVPFTGDPTKLEAGLEQLARGSAALPTEPQELDQLSGEAEWFREVEAAGGGGSAGGVALSQQLLASRAFHDMEGKTAALKGLLGVLGGVEGKRILVLATHRLSRYAGLEYFLGRRANVEDSLSPDARGWDARPLLESMAESANAYGVTLYGLYPAGRTVTTPSAADPRSDNPDFLAGAAGMRDDLVVNNEAEALELVAERTGGVIALGARDIAATIPRIAEDLESYYSIGYIAPAGPPDRTAAISVRVRGRDLVVRARRALVEKSDSSRMKDRVLSNLFIPDGSSRLGISVAVRRRGDAKKRRFHLALEIRVPIGGLVLVPGAKGSSGAFSVFVVTEGARREISGVTERRRPFEIPASELERARSSFFTYDVDVDKGDGEAVVSVGVLDEVGKEAGFARVHVPPLPRTP